MSLEDEVRAHLDIARGLSDASLSVASGQASDEINIPDTIAMILETTKALMDCTVDLAKAIDTLAGHVGFPPPDE